MWEYVCSNEKGISYLFVHVFYIELSLTGIKYLQNCQFTKRIVLFSILHTDAYSRQLYLKYVMKI